MSLLSWPALVLLVAAQSLQAQTFPKPQVRSHFDGGTAVLLQPGDPPKARIEQAGGKKREITFPTWAMDGDFFDGTFWAMKWSAHDSGERTFEVFDSPDGKHWHLDGSGNNLAEEVYNVFPLARGKYLLVAMDAFRREGLASPLALAETDDARKIRITRLVDLGFQSRKAKKDGPPLGLEPWQFQHFFMLGKGMVVRVPGGVAVVSDRTGYLWLVRVSEEGSFSTRRVRIFDAVDEKRLKSGQPLELAVLGCQPTPEGDLLIATRSEDAVLKGRIEFPDHAESADDMKDANKQGRWEANRKAALEKYPDLGWWSLKVDSGSLKRVPPPEGAPTRIGDLGIMRGFNFRVLPSGGVVVSE